MINKVNLDLNNLKLLRSLVRVLLVLFT